MGQLASLAVNLLYLANQFLHFTIAYILVEVQGVPYLVWTSEPIHRVFNQAVEIFLDVSIEPFDMGVPFDFVQFGRRCFFWNRVSL